MGVIRIYNLRMNSKHYDQDRPGATVLARSSGGTAADASVVEQRISRMSSRSLFAGAQEVEIEHNGSVYRLRQTSLGKLILTK
jgi:hemin uptake protein HemP